MAERVSKILVSGWSAKDGSLKNQLQWAIRTFIAQALL